MTASDTVSPVVPRRRRRQSVRDVIVVGGGMAGAAAALALARDGLDVTLIETRHPTPWVAADEVDLRVVALAPSSVACLDDLGVWAAVRAARAQPYRHMHVWDAENGAVLDIDAADGGHAEMGWIVENRLVQHQLWQALAAAGVHCRCPATVAGLDMSAEHVAVRLEDGDVLDARVLVAADGAASPVRRMAGITTRGRDYDQRAVVAHVDTARAHRETAWQRFMPGGPLAFLPLDDGRCSVVWSLPDAGAARVLAMDDAAFCRALSVAGDMCLGPVTGSGPRAAFPLRLTLARDFHRGRVVLLGDAAHAVHPLAGQGINLGLRDVVGLREVLTTAHAAGGDIGAPHVLARYARRRRSADTVDALSLDALARIYAWQTPPLVALRGLGMRAVNRLSPLKRALAAHAAGR